MNFPFFDIFIATVLRDNARKRRKTTFNIKVEIVNLVLKKNQDGFGSVVVENETPEVGRIWENPLKSYDIVCLYKDYTNMLFTGQKSIKNHEIKFCAH